MGSDWWWELEVPAARPETALRRTYQLAAQHDLRPRRYDGLITIIDDEGDQVTVGDFDAAMAAMAAGAASQWWTKNNDDVFVRLKDGRLSWSMPTFGPHGRLTALWLDVARFLDARLGRVLDEWSSEQVWDLHDATHPTAGNWPAELGWLTYAGPSIHPSAPPLPEVAARTRVLSNGARLVTLLDDPASVDPLHYEQLHRRWLNLPGEHLRPEQAR
ncbi:hypothetical protein ACIA5C_09420 [Actinoplanes sp. NPDC051343]|uniref:hypothetical protein n=1 Tax=Actinoplanes sp. NPDC051343 TaxID=3363906 RepID=UPI003787C46F